MTYSLSNQNMSTTANTTSFTIPSEVMACVMKTDYCEFTFSNLYHLRIVLQDGTISSSKVTLTAAVKDKHIIDGTLDIECNY